MALKEYTSTPACIPEDGLKMRLKKRLPDKMKVKGQRRSRLIDVVKEDMQAISITVKRRILTAQDRS